MKYDLVFEGGGAKGLVFVGAIQAFMNLGHEFGRVIGSSAGAITATLLATGYNADEISALITERMPNGQPRFTSFLDEPQQFKKGDIQDSLSYRLLEEVDIPGIPKVIEKFLPSLLIEGLMMSSTYRHIFSFIERGGWFAGDAFLDWLMDKLNAKGQNLGQATLTEFHARTQKDLSLLASDTTNHEMLVLNHRTAPSCPVVQAVRMSMSYPFAWQEVRWNPGWGQYRKKDISGHVIIDGGMLSNFPIELFVSSDKEVLAVMGRAGRSPDVLGFLIDETLPVPGSEETDVKQTEEAKKKGLLSKVDIKELETVNRIKRMIDTVTQAHDKFVIDAFQEKVCRLPAKGYGTLDFDMSDTRRDALIKAGRQATEAYFKALAESQMN